MSKYLQSPIKSLRSSKVVFKVVKKGTLLRGDCRYRHFHHKSCVNAPGAVDWSLVPDLPSFHLLPSAIDRHQLSDLQLVLKYNHGQPKESRASKLRADLQHTAGTIETSIVELRYKGRLRCRCIQLLQQLSARPNDRVLFLAIAILGSSSTKYEDPTIRNR